jgi:hypothetical protein
MNSLMSWLRPSRPKDHGLAQSCPPTADENPPIEQTNHIEEQDCGQ